MTKYRVGQKLDVRMTPLGKCVYADVCTANGDHADYVVILHIRGDKPHAQAVRDWHGDTVGIVEIEPHQEGR